AGRQVRAAARSRSRRLGRRLRCAGVRPLSLMTPAELEAAFRAIGAERYHNRHPFHRMLHGGRCTPDQVRAWALNRFYYQAQIPAKDSALMARLPTPELRRIWRQRIVDH